MKPSSEEKKEAYAHFGGAYYFGEVLHRGLCNLYAASRSPEQGGVTRPRLEELMNYAYEQTMGQIVTNLSDILPADLVERLRKAVKMRNYLAHHFWFEQIHMMATVEGVHSMIDELSGYSKVFAELDREIDTIIQPYYVRIGLTEKMMADFVAEASRGQPMDPLKQQRRLKKEEVIIVVYDVPTEAGGRTLVFETNDHVLWELCDVGLGWSLFEQVGSDWERAEAFSGLLPARVRPRPDVKASWEYDIPFGPKATLVIHLAPDKRKFVYRLKRKGHPRREAG